MENKHNYTQKVKWTGNTGTGTSGYKAYERSHSILVENKVNFFALLILYFEAMGPNIIRKTFCWPLFHLVTCYSTSICVRWQALS